MEITQEVQEEIARVAYAIYPFNLLNYAFGLTHVSLRDYVPASWIGMIPGTVMYVYLGSLAGSLAERKEVMPARPQNGRFMLSA